jgi:hemolysin III
VSVLVYGVALVTCYAASARYHAAIGPPERVAALRRLDHVGIHLLIAGTYTPVATILLRGAWRRGTLIVAWLAAFAGCAVVLTRGILPSWLSTTLYLGLGWGAYFAYREMHKRHPASALRPILDGGILYSLGAVINLAGWPAPWPGVIGAHELLHLFVLAGSFTHFTFILGLVAPTGAGLWAPGGAGVRLEAGHRPLRLGLVRAKGSRDRALPGAARRVGEA